jgi:hypothetical protein
MASATECHRCQTSLINLPAPDTATIAFEEPVKETPFQDETVQAQRRTPQNAPFEISPDNSIGRQTFFWYRFYLVFMTLFYGTCAVLGILSLYMSQVEANQVDAGDMLISGITLTFVGIPLAFFFLIGIFLPRKSWNWIVGIVYISVGMMSCCFLPATIPLIIYWIKPETQTYLGRK